MPVEDILEERANGGSERDVRNMVGSAAEASGDMDRQRKRTVGSDSNREAEEQASEDSKLPLTKNPLRGRVEVKTDTELGPTLIGGLIGLL